MTETSIGVRAAKGTGVLIGQSIVNALLGTIFFMYMVRVLTKTEVGVYGAATLAYTVGITIGTLGLDYAVSRFIPTFYGRGDEAGIKLIAKRVTLFSSFSAVSLSLIYFALSGFLSNFMLETSAYTNIFQISALVVFTGTLSFAAIGVLQGFQKFTHLAIFRFVAQIARVGVSIWLLFIGLGVAAVLWGYMLFYLILIVLIALIVVGALSKSSSSDTGTPSSPLPVRSLLAFSLPLMGYRLVEYASNSVDQYIVLGALGVQALGVYTVVYTAATFILTVFALPFIMTLIPSFSEIYGRTGAEKVSDTLKHSTRYVSMFFIPTSLGVAAISPLALHVLGGVPYIEGALPLAIICIGASVYGFSIAIISALTALGETRKVILVISIATVIEFVACLGLTSIFAVPGAALGRALMYLAMLLLFIYVGSKAIPIGFDGEAVFGSLLSASLMAVLLYFIASLTDFRFILLPFYLILAAIVYFLGLSALRIIRLEDIQLMCKILPRGETLYSKIEQAAKDQSLLSRIIRLLCKLN